MNELLNTVTANVHAWIVTTGARLRHDERGSVTIQEVLWAIAAIGFVAIVVGAITAYLNNQAGLIR